MKHVKNLHRLTANMVLTGLKIARFLAIIALFVLIYEALLDQFLDGSNQIIPILIFWVISAYVVIPRIHRLITNYYLPNYYVGRIRSPSGFLSDPINIAFIGDTNDLHAAMQQAGWTLADKLTPQSFMKTVWAIIVRRSYKSAPVGDMFLFNRRQDFAYEIEVGDTPNARHHIRFWKTPKGWLLPGGSRVDWLAAATFDKSIGLKIATGQLDHMVHINVDEERDFTIDTLLKTGLVSEIQENKNFNISYHDRSNGGDRIKTDGALPFIFLKSIVE